MNRKTISGWVRQSRYRAKRYDISSSLTVADAAALLDFYQRQCAYCQAAAATTMDHAFPLSDGAPNVAANTLPACKDCKNAKHIDDLVKWYSKGGITKDRYVTLFQEMLTRTGGDLIKQHVKHITGMLDG